MPVLWRHPLECLQAFTITEDHASQESVWQALPDWQKSPRAIRQALTETDVPSRDPRARFVGFEAYEAAGGTVRRDLFDPQEGGYLQDAALLDRLARDKLEAVAAEVREEGWCWVEVRLSFGWEERQALLRPLLEAVRAEAERLEAERETLWEEESGTGETRLDEIVAGCFAWPDADKAQAGAVVTLSEDGEVLIDRGLRRPEDTLPDTEHDTREEGDAEPAAARDRVPASLIEELTAQQTAALRIETARRPDVALALAVCTMVSALFHHGGRGALKLRLAERSLRPSIREHAACPALLALQAEAERVRAMLPEDAAELWPWCRAASREIGPSS